jgi:hypothetical protein
VYFGQFSKQTILQKGGGSKVSTQRAETAWTKSGYPEALPLQNRRNLIVKALKKYDK